MSHSTVLVIGENPEAQLEPYFENWNSTERLVGPVENEDMARFRKYCIKQYKADRKLGFEELYKQYGEEYNGNIWKPDEKGEWHEYSTYNEHSKWDWYLLGGRWRGFFKLKKGKSGLLGESGVGGNDPMYDVDRAKKGDIDFEFMMNEARIKAEDRYKKAMEVIGQYDKVTPWKDFTKRIDSGEIDIDQARKLYHSQHRVVAVSKFNEENHDESIKIFGWDGEVEDFNKTLEEYVDTAGKESIITFAVLKDGKWYERGSMGWWGIVSNEMEDGEWTRKFYELVMGLPDDTVLSVYDVHI